MSMEFLELIFYPIITAMKYIMELGYSASQTYGGSIIFLSIVVSVAIYPLSKYAGKLQKEERLLQSRLEPLVRVAKKQFKGEKRFLEIEKIYKAHDYHPIKSLKTVSGLAVQIPFLLSALLLLLDYSPLENTSFLFIADLSKPDALIGLPSSLDGYINLLPFVMTALSVVEGYLTPEITAKERMKANFISAVIFMLVYALPASVVFYWACNNFWSLLRVVVNRLRG